MEFDDRDQRHLHRRSHTARIGLLDAGTGTPRRDPFRRLQPGLSGTAGPRRASSRAIPAASMSCWCASKTGAPGQAVEFVEAVREAAGTPGRAADRRPLRRRRPNSTTRCARGVADLPSVHLITAAEIAALYPVAEIHDPHANELGHVPYTPRLFRRARHGHRAQDPRDHRAALQGDRARLRRHAVGGHLRRRRPRRRGARCAAPRAAGVHGARAGDEGMLLALCSKNNEEDVAATFQRPSRRCRCGWTDFAAQRINWETKGAQPGIARRRTGPRPRQRSSWSTTIRRK